MKTAVALLNVNNNGINSSLIARKPSNIHRRYWTDAQGRNDMNENATMARMQGERDLCEEELYRLRCALKDILASMTSSDYENRRQHARADLSISPRSMGTNMNDKMTSWTMGRCSPCCRRSRRRHERRQYDNDAVECNPLILKILESKVLDCLCDGYTKDKPHVQIKKALSEINQRPSKTDSDSVGTPSSTIYESPSVSSALSSEYLPTSPNIAPSPSIVSAQLGGSPTPVLSNETSSVVSPSGSDKNKIKGVLKEGDKQPSPRKKSKVTIVADKSIRSISGKSKKKKIPSSKTKKKPNSRSKRSKSSGKTSLSPGHRKSSQAGTKKTSRRKSSSRSSTKSKSNKKKNSKNPKRK